jgi:hypothetical protein
MVCVMTAICYITQGQSILVGGFHFHAIRIVLLAGIIRIAARGEFPKFKVTGIDGAIVLFAVVTYGLMGLRLGVWQESVGHAYDVLLSYFVFRGLITSWEEVQALLPGLAVLIMPMAVCMLRETHTGRSVFAFMGGLADVDPDREGRFRAAGAFRSPHDAGAFGATLIPLFVGLYWVNRKRRVIAVAGIIAATLITYASNSSGPLMAYLSCLIGLAFWPLRMHMRKVRWGIVVFLICMGLTMKVPIWYLMSKIADLTRGDGWYRSYLMEQCWNHMSSWWLMGVTDTSGWAATGEGKDLCNIYVGCAAGGGMGSLILFVVILVKSFQKLGMALKTARESLPESEAVFWCMGCILFAHVMTLFSVSYWDQMTVFWWGTLAGFASAASSVLDAQPATGAMEEIPESETSPAAAAV